MVGMGDPKHPEKKVSTPKRRASASKTKAASSQSSQSAQCRNRSRSEPTGSPTSGSPPQILETGAGGDLSPAQKRFLTAISQIANITQAAELAGVARSSHYRWLREPRYRKAFLEARESALDRLELEAWKRATTGSDRLLIFLLSSYRPRFRPETPPIGPVYHELAEMSEEELLAQARRELKELGYENLEELWGGGNE